MLPTNNIHYHLTPLVELFEQVFNKSGKELKVNSTARVGWSSRTWVSDLYRRADLSVVESKGLWMMHSCIFPHIHNDAPIFGFDIFAGKNKITGCFHDFSPINGYTHVLNTWFTEQTKDFLWKRSRELPEWALQIFSNSIVAVGNVQDIDEISKIIQMAKLHLNHYVNHVGDTNHLSNDNTKYQNFYCRQQKQNPHNPRVLCSLGLTLEEANDFINNQLFPEIT